MKRSPRSSRTPCSLSDSAYQQIDTYALRAGKLQLACRTSKICLQAAGSVLLVLAVLGHLIVTAKAAEAQTYSVLYSFKGAPDGSYPYASSILDSAGNLYGTTGFGGVSYWGTAFKLDPSGKETVLYNFLGGYGEVPAASLFRDSDGNLYGTSEYGGSYNKGAIFKLDKRGNETVLHSFSGGTDGALPSSALVQDEDGNLYGSAPHGGDLSCGGGPVVGCGVVFKLDSVGKETVLHTFRGQTDGAVPNGVILDQAGNLYGTTIGGGSGCYGDGCGTIFELDKAGKLTVLYSFTGTAGDGANPFAGVTRDAAGNLYGTTLYGGDLSCYSNGCGTVFVLDHAGKEKVLHAFTGTKGDGKSPVAGVIEDPAGDLYGMTPFGGATGDGTVFKLNKSGRETVLYTFKAGWADGAEPSAGLILDRDGNLYGTTPYGGDFGCDVRLGCGVVFKLTP